MKLIAGLGNPGKAYENQRHNLGFMVIDRIADQTNISIAESKFKAIYGKGNIGLDSVILVKPMTYMNLSGEAVVSLARYFKIEIDDIIILSDDLSIDFGRIRIRRSGSDGGHNGLKSISHHLSSKNFTRIRLGIGSPSGFDVSHFVLSNFTEDEKQKLPNFIDAAKDSVITLLTESLDSAMQKFNS